MESFTTEQRGLNLQRTRLRKRKTPFTIGTFVHTVRKIDGRVEEGYVKSVKEPKGRGHFHVTIELKNGGGVYESCITLGDKVTVIHG